MKNIVQRHKFILDELNENGYVDVQELSKTLEVSEVTIRKDLKYLESKKMLYRSHGGASSLSTIISDKHIDIKEKLFREEKSRIAKAASNLIELNDKIIIASGTTLLAFAHEIREKENLTVITASLKVSQALCYNQHIDIVQLGGILRKNSVSVIGHYAKHMLDGLSCTKLFIGVDGIDFDYGLTTSDIGEALLNQKMIEVSQKIIVLTDSSKFENRGFSKICDINKIHQIITDTNAPSTIIKKFKDKGIEVTLV